jgi:hypothetical protein
VIPDIRPGSQLFRKKAPRERGLGGGANEARRAGARKQARRAYETRAERRCSACQAGTNSVDGHVDPPSVSVPLLQLVAQFAKLLRQVVNVLADLMDKRLDRREIASQFGRVRRLTGASVELLAKLAQFACAICVPNARSARSQGFKLFSAKTSEFLFRNEFSGLALHLRYEIPSNQLI